jgi:D-alanyl-D-alanine carboxypeptidase (penicillin-binding protein 5/6)
LGSRGVVVQPLAGAPALPSPAQLPASSWLVADATTGQVLAAKAAHARFLPASTLKMLTAVTLLPRFTPSMRVRVSNADASVDGSRVGLVPGKRYTVATLFTSLLVVSANDAAEALANAAGGNRATLAAMNAEAHHLQADDTVAMTPSGLDGTGESSSAYDLALIARAGLAMPSFRHYVGIIRAKVPGRHHKHFAIYTHNQLLTTYRGDIGVKNGYTVAAMGTDVQAATRHGHTILVTLMHANPNFWPMARNLLNWGFAAEGKVTPVGSLVPPLSATQSAAVAAVNHSSGQPLGLGLRRHGHGTSSLDLSLLSVSALAVVLTVGSRGQRRRRRRRFGRA